MNRRTIMLVIIAGLTLLLAALWDRTPGGGDHESPLAVSPLIPAATLTVRAERLSEMQAAATATLALLNGTANSGPATLGTEIYVNQRKLKLPDDVYVVAYVVEIYCTEGFPCEPKPPYYALAYADDETGLIGVEQVGGDIFDDPNVSLEKNLQTRQRFAWLYKALSQKMP
ncbi:MAG: hypothetical protein R2867_42090 [Caldilineaceae bacterium]